ncbi:MAG: 16S rRNA (cytidine(1402)-2'-O)-methyltransferase [Chloroflexota bacterium]|nr:MAG: 16S rRNA (cytidine(1402)-2'-O)-methyltransferase [Chloroflexota bacterium]
MAEGAVGTGGIGGTLFLVATPIGNLGDVTIRALEVLRAVPLIAAEDTRIARRLLSRYEIGTRTLSYHARSGPGRQVELLAHLRDGADLALVTDAGTPAVSDPGSELAAAWAAEGGRVEAIPGASAVLAAVAVSGLAGPQWVFEGFLPRSGRSRRDRLAAIAADERGAVIFEAPGRLRATLADLVAACGPTRPGAVCRELTKLHEQVVRGSLAGLEAAAGDGTILARGEVVIVVGWSSGGARGEDGGAAERAAADDEASALAAVEALVIGGLGRAEAARRVAAATGIPRRRLYRVGASR